MRLSNKTLFSIHSWLGINLGFLLFVICFSGTIATLSYEIDWLLDPALRNQHQPTIVPEQTFGEIYNTVQQAYPNAGINILRKTQDSYLPVQAHISDIDRGELIVYIDRFTGAVLAERDRVTVKTFFRIFHKQFFIISTPYTFHGLYIVGLFGLFLLLSAVSGLLLLGSWLKNMTRLRWHKGIRILLVDWHRSSGLWALIFSLLFALTGIWYLIEKVADISEVFMVRTHAVDYASYGDHLPKPNIDLYTSSAKQALPQLQIQTILLPDRPDKAVHIIGQARAWLVRDAANYIALDPYNGEVLHKRDAVNLGLLDRWLHTVDPLHFGDFGSLWSKIIWFVFGLIISLSILVGIYLWLLRSRTAGPMNHHTGRKTLIATHLLTGIILVIATLFSIAGINRMQSGGADSHTINYGSHAIGPWQVSINQGLREQGLSGSFYLQFQQPRPNIKNATLYLQSANDISTIEFDQSWYAFKATVDNTFTAEPGDLLQQNLDSWHRQWEAISLQLESYDGRIFSYILDQHDIANGLATVTETAAPVSSHKPVMIFIIIFLILVWAIFIVWLYILLNTRHLTSRNRQRQELAKAPAINPI